jgi:flavin-dependent dehydrogenase
MEAGLDAIASRNWDVAVIGAGPAGSVAASVAARQGASVLLIEKEKFPRSKVCGCCVNRSAAAMLTHLGLIPEKPSPVLMEFRLLADSREARIELPPGGFAVSRARLDALLAEQAVQCGASFIQGCSAIVAECHHDGRWIELHQDSKCARVKARIVIGAAGLTGVRFADGRELPYKNSRFSRIGAGVILPYSGDAEIVPPSVIAMNCAREGYAGMVRLEDGSFNIAAAIAPGFVRHSGGIGHAVEKILKSAGFVNAPELHSLSWRGTPPLTRRPVYSCAERVIVVGDAAGYVEPFTGEGIAWAIEQGAAAGELAARAALTNFEGIEAEWEKLAKQFAERRRTCKFLASMLRLPSFTRGVVRALDGAPYLARPILARLNREPT